MNRKRIHIPQEIFPEQFRPLTEGTPVYDSSCSPEARVYFLDRDGGLFLKTAPKGSLAREAEMTRYFHSKGLAPLVLDYLSLDRDWLLTQRIPGEDCLHRDYLDDPQRLCDTLAGILRQLHTQSFEDCPVQDLNTPCLADVLANHNAGKFSADLFPGSWVSEDPREAWAIIREGRHRLKADTLIHGDYCLPNVMLENWQFRGFLDVGGGGVGDRHFDLFWGIWTLFFNLKTERYTNRFLDAYGRDRVDPEMLRIIAAIERFR